MSYTSLGGIQTIAGVFIGLTIIAVALRFYARALVKVGFRADDWCMLFALLTFLVFCSCVLVLGQMEWIGGSATHYPPSEQDARYRKAIKVTLCVVFFLNITLAVVKISALLLYQRIFCLKDRQRSTFEKILIATGIFTVCWLISYTTLAFWQYHHNIQNLPTLTGGNGDLTIGWQDVVALCVIDLVLDIWVVSLPIPKACFHTLESSVLQPDLTAPQVLALHMTRTHKILTVGVFSVAFVGVAASIARLVNIILLDYNLSSYAHSEHPLTRVYFFHILELGTSILAVNSPVMWGVFTKLYIEDLGRLRRAVSHLTSHGSDSSTRNRSISRSVRGPPDPVGIKLHDIEGLNQAQATHAASEISDKSVPSSGIVIHESVDVSSASRDSSF